jgi:hypothetical protein
MRPPRMTTRRWMAAVAIVALSLGGSHYAIRLKHRRDRYLAQAMVHSSLEAQALRSLASAPARFALREPGPTSMPGDEVAGAIDRVSGLAAGGSDEHLGHVSYREDQEARERAIAPARRRILVENQRKEGERLRKQSDYHAALARKYRYAASRPWITIEPDPPEPN